MANKYCRYCNIIAETRVIGGYTQIPFRGGFIKRRRVVHRFEDGGCGNVWYTYEIPEHLLSDELPSDEDD